MTLSVCAISSGSNGNCYLVRTAESAILIDAGISATAILKQVARARLEREDISALFLTHEHSDHVRGARVLMKRLPHANVFASAGTMNAVMSSSSAFDPGMAEERRRIISPEMPVAIGDMTVRAFRTLHDVAEPYGYSVSCGGKEVAIVTDTGAVTDEMLESVASADLLVLESNHDIRMLREGGYPVYLKQRILSDYGHLSNVQAADVLTKLQKFGNRKRVVLLAHLSGENNTPAIAEHTVLTLLAKAGIYTGENLYLGVLERNAVSMIYEL